MQIKMPSPERVTAFLYGWGVTFLYPHKKVTKEGGIGEGAECRAPARQIRSPLCTLPVRIAGRVDDETAEQGSFVH